MLQKPDVKLLSELNVFIHERLKKLKDAKVVGLEKRTKNPKENKLTE